MHVKQYDHYIALDWAESNMAIAKMTKKSNEINVIDLPSNIKDLKLYLAQLKGHKIMTVEETTTSQWLYTELFGLVDELIICDPYRNSLLSEGAKTDKIDAIKLVHLLRSGLLKEVYHSFSDNIILRNIVSGYGDLIKAGVRFKNQKSSLIRSRAHNVFSQFVLDNINKQIEEYETAKKRYAQKFKALGKKNKAIRLQRSLPGIDWIGAVKIVARVTEPRRFSNKGRYLSYCGLIKLDRKSGGRNYGRKASRYSRELKSVYKTAAMAAIGGKNPMNSYYKYLIEKKRYPEYQARHTVARRIAVLSYGIFKEGKRYRDYEK